MLKNLTIFLPEPGEADGAGTRRPLNEGQSDAPGSRTWVMEEMAAIAWPLLV